LRVLPETMKLQIIPGAGTEESKNFADILMRMYCLYCENNKVKWSKILSETWELTGNTEKLKQEHGIHRLVRVSPFDSQVRRHMSFAKVIIDDQEIKSDYQIRSYVLHPYQLIKNHSTNQSTGEVGAVLDGDLEKIWNAPIEPDSLP